MPENEDWTMGEVVRTLGRIEEGQRDLKAEFREMRTGYVGRDEYDEHKKHVNEKFEQIDSRRAPWWSVAAVILATLSIVVTVAIALL